MKSFYKLCALCMICMFVTSGGAITATTPEFTPEYIQTLSPDAINALTYEQIQSLNPRQVKLVLWRSFTSRQKSMLTQSQQALCHTIPNPHPQFTHLTTDDLRPIRRDATLFPHPILITDEGRYYDPTRIRSVDNTIIINQITDENHLNFLVRSLTSRQISTLTEVQFWLLFSPERISLLNLEQIVALYDNTNNIITALFSPTYTTELSKRKTELARWTTRTPEQIAKLTLEQFRTLAATIGIVESLSTVQKNALIRKEIEFAWLSSQEQIKQLKLSQILELERDRPEVIEGLNRYVRTYLNSIKMAKMAEAEAAEAAEREKAEAEAAKQARELSPDSIREMCKKEDTAHLAIDCFTPNQLLNLSYAQIRAFNARNTHSMFIRSLSHEQNKEIEHEQRDALGCYFSKDVNKIIRELKIPDEQQHETDKNERALRYFVTLMTPKQISELTLVQTFMLFSPERIALLTQKQQIEALEARSSELNPDQIKALMARKDELTQSESKKD